eukprot:1040070-Pelagomonas_calceolata.AAC.3
MFKLERYTEDKHGPCERKSTLVFSPSTQSFKYPTDVLKGPQTLYSILQAQTLLGWPGLPAA